MAHRALTLKYRPQVFSDLIGQDHVSLVLARALEGGRVAHAYLFTGARGVGKTTSARLLAKALNCERRRAGKLKGHDPCNACTSCVEITSGVSLDVAEIDGASNRGIADVQALREKVRFAPTGGHHRVVIIDEVHQLSNDAFAALLKTLEEPPPHLVFIFATTDPQKLPDTIRSRTQRFDFARVPLRKVADRLLEIQKREAADADGNRFTLSEGAALLLAHKSEGSMRDAVSALDQVISAGETDVDEELVRRVLGLADREAFFRLAGAILERDPRAALRELHAAFEKGLDPRDLAEGLSEHVRHILVLKVDPQAGDLVALSREDLERLKAQGGSWSEADLLRLLKLASEVSWPMRDSAQPLVHLEAAVMQMATLEPGETLAELLARLESLEQRLGAGGSGGAPARTGPPSPAAPRAAGPGGARAAGVATGGGVAPPPMPPPPAAVAPAMGAPATGVRAGAYAPRAQAGAPRPAASQAGPAGGPTFGAPLPRAEAPRATAPTALEDAEPALDPDCETRWRAAVVAINGRKRMLGAFLEESRLLGLAGDGVVLAMDELHRAVVEEKDNRALIAEEVQRAFGRALLVRCHTGAGPVARPQPPSLDDVQPMVDQAIAFFEGEIVEKNGRDRERNGG
jgi:DNA polymerase-3 subunit gamma/tau